MNPVLVPNSIIQHITSIAPQMNLFPSHCHRSTEPVRVSFPTTTPIIVPSLVATPPPSSHPIILENSEFTKNVNPFITAKSLAFASATGILFDLGSDIFGDYGCGDKREEQSRGGSEDYWSRFYSLSGVWSAIQNNEVPQQEWDSHGLPANITVQLNELTWYKNYMVYDILIFDKKSGETLGSDDPLIEVVDICPGEIYNKAELQKKLEDLQTCAMFENVELELKTNFDGTISIKIGFVEITWDYSNKLRCISVGQIPESNPVENDEGMTVEEEWELHRTKQREYKRRIERSRPCILPDSEQREILKVLKKRGKVRSRSLLEMKHRVEKWYKENGFSCAQVVNFGNLHTKEVVCEVMEGDITRIEFQFQDKLGNVFDGDTKLPLIKKEVPKQFREGQIFNMEHGNQALENIYNLRLYSQTEMHSLQDDNNEGGIIIQFVLRDPLYA